MSLRGAEGKEGISGALHSVPVSRERERERGGLLDKAALLMDEGIVYCNLQQRIAKPVSYG